MRTKVRSTMAKRSLLDAEEEMRKGTKVNETLKNRCRFR